MRPQLAALAVAQGGLVTRRQAVAADYTERELRTLTGHRGAWVTVRRGVYIRRDVWEALDARRGRPIRRVLAAHLTMTRPHAISHRSAGLLHNLPMLDARDDLVHISRPGVTGSRTEHGVKHHTASYRPDQVVEVGGVPTLDLARTVADIGREHGYLHGLVAADAALQRRVSRTQLELAIAPMTCWPGVTAARAAIVDCDGGAESVGETLARVLVIEAGLGPVETQFAVIVDGVVYYADLRVGRHLFEFDGEVKYLPESSGGLARRAPSDVVVDEKRRQDLICGQDLGMSRLVWADVWGPGRDAAKIRLRREYAATVHRFGDQLPADFPTLPPRVRRAS